MIPCGCYTLTLADIALMWQTAPPAHPAARHRPSGQPSKEYQNLPVDTPGPVGQDRAAMNGREKRSSWNRVRP